jgi:broad specificity phosphatase PhoE
MKVILIRHGEKSNISSDHSKNYLSPNGQKQALSLAKQVENQILPNPTHLLSSEFERTSETLKPLSDLFHLNIIKKREFDLQDYNETSRTFRDRVTRGLSYLTTFPADSVVYVCSHQDWLQEALTIISSTDSSVLKFNSWPTTRYLLFQVPSNQITEWTLIKEGRILW